MAVSGLRQTRGLAARPVGVAYPLPTALLWGAREMDLDYLIRRLDDETQRALEATCPEARKAHLALAKQYEERIAVLRGDKRLGLRVVGR